MGKVLDMTNRLNKYSTFFETKGLTIRLNHRTLGMTVRVGKEETTLSLLEQFSLFNRLRKHLKNNVSNGIDEENQQSLIKSVDKGTVMWYNS